MYTVVQRSNDLVNTAELQHYFQGLKQIFDNPEYRRQFQEYQKNINEIEKKQLLSGNTCTLGKLKYDQDRLPNISPIAMKNLLMNRFYDPIVMKEIACTLNSIVFMQPSYAGSVKVNERLKRWLQNLVQIGSESAEGYAFKADFDEIGRAHV